MRSSSRCSGEFRDHPQRRSRTPRQSRRRTFCVPCPLCGSDHADPCHERCHSRCTGVLRQRSGHESAGSLPQSSAAGRAVRRSGRELQDCSGTDILVRSRDWDVGSRERSGSYRSAGDGEHPGSYGDRRSCLTGTARRHSASAGRISETPIYQVFSERMRGVEPPYSAWETEVP